MTMSLDLVNHKKWSGYKIDARIGKSTLKLIRRSILESLKNVKELCAGWQSYFPYKS